VLWAENLAAIESEGRRLGGAVRRDPKRPVPQYPGWTLADLAAHTASIHGRTILICRELPAERISAPRLPEGADPVGWYEETLEMMLDTLEQADPETTAWAFGPRQNLGFWERRMVIETGIHRWDAFRAWGDEDDLTLRVAESGLDEFAEMWMPHLGEAPLPPLGLEATVIPRSWAYGEGQPEATVAGTASDLYLRLMSRPSSVQLPKEWEAAVDGLPPPPKR
jgi:uncharacterized protein (TIGR03083 family)